MSTLFESVQETFKNKNLEHIHEENFKKIVVSTSCQLKYIYGHFAIFLVIQHKFAINLDPD